MDLAKKTKAELIEMINNQENRELDLVKQLQELSETVDSAVSNNNVLKDMIAQKDKSFDEIFNKSTEKDKEIDEFKSTIKKLNNDYHIKLKEINSLALSKKQWVEMADHRGEIINELAKKNSWLILALSISLTLLVILIFAYAM